MTSDFPKTFFADFPKTDKIVVDKQYFDVSSASAASIKEPGPAIALPTAPSGYVYYLHGTNSNGVTFTYPSPSNAYWSHSMETGPLPLKYKGIPAATPSNLWPNLFPLEDVIWFHETSEMFHIYHTSLGGCKPGNKKKSNVSKNDAQTIFKQFKTSWCETCRKLVDTHYGK
jgi:hypothetical protein